MNTKQEWEQCKTDVFWGEIAPTEHLVQFYENDEVILEALEGFVESGFNAGDSVVIIATEEHLQALTDRLIGIGFDLEELRSTYQYIPLDAQLTLASFMVDGWPNEALFMKLVSKIITSARGEHNRRVRAYGEMVALLWQQGYNGATIHLEHLWNKFCETEAFCLFCAYPKGGFTQDINSSIEHICSTHTKMLSGLEKSKTEVFYKKVERKEG